MQTRLRTLAAITAIVATASTALSEPPPPFAFKWGSRGTGDGQFSQAWGIAVGPNGHVYVADTQSNRVQEFDNLGGFVRRWGSAGGGNGQFASPEGIAVDASGNVYVTDTYSHRVQKFTATGAFIAKWGSECDLENGTGCVFGGDGQFFRPDGIAIDGNGDVYVADTFNFRIQKFDANGVFIRKWGTRGTAPNEFDQLPTGVAADAANTVYVTDASRILKFDSNGVFLATWGSSGLGNGELSGVHGIAIDRLDRVYVADTGSSRVQKFDTAGTFLTTWGHLEGSMDGQFSVPMAVAIDSGGTVYVLDTGNFRVQAFSPSIGVTGTSWSTLKDLYRRRNR